MTRTRIGSNAATTLKLAQLAVAAPQVVALRTGRMLAAGANPSAADRAEFSGMYTEKVHAFWASMFGMATQAMRANQEYARTAALRSWRVWAAPWSFGSNAAWLKAASTVAPMPSNAEISRAASNIVAAAVAPIHKRATANARRLAKPRKR